MTFTCVRVSNIMLCNKTESVRVTLLTFASYDASLSVNDIVIGQPVSTW